MFADRIMKYIFYTNNRSYKDLVSIKNFRFPSAKSHEMSCEKLLRYTCIICVFNICTKLITIETLATNRSNKGTNAYAV